MPLSELRLAIERSSSSWLVTGAAGFIGSNLVEQLLRWGQKVIGADNFSTGHRKNINYLLDIGNKKNCGSFEFFEGDIQDFKFCKKIIEPAQIILHQAALGSVPRSIESPLNSHQSNVDGFINMLQAAVEANISRFVYASSSSVYGDDKNLPKIETSIGKPLSPYACTKLINEIYAENFQYTYDLSCTGLRYFNVFGKRQDPNGAYAAVIPKWISQMLTSEKIQINGDGTTSRDFCFIENVIQANLRAGLATPDQLTQRAYNVSCGSQTSLNELYSIIAKILGSHRPSLNIDSPNYVDFRKGDVLHSLGDIAHIQHDIGYAPTKLILEGLNETMEWYIADSEIRNEDK